MGMDTIKINLSKQPLSEIRDRKSPPCVHRCYELLPMKRLASYYLHRTDIFKNDNEDEYSSFTVCCFYKHSGRNKTIQKQQQLATEVFVTNDCPY